MKNQILNYRTLIILAGFFMCTLTCTSQTKATGHVFAEIVETVSITSQTNDFIRIENSQANNELNLGEIHIKSTDNAIWDIEISTELLTGNAGETDGFEASLLKFTKETSNSEQVLNIFGAAEYDTLEQSGNLFTAICQVTFIYN